MTREELIAAVDARIAEITKALDKLNDETAVDVVVLFDQWEPWHEYLVGERVRDGDKLYRVAQRHTSQPDWRPASVPALFVEIAKPGEIDDWKQPTGAHDAYSKGDKVKYGGYVWTSDIDGNIWEPGVHGWTKVD